MIPVRTAKQLKELDNFTIINKPISGLDLMELAASRLCDELVNDFSFNSVSICCGPGNNGGDGLALARLLSERDIDVKCYVVMEEKGSPEYIENLNRLPSTVHVGNLTDMEIQTDILVDALFGSGLNREIEGFLSKVIEKINSFTGSVISVDIPSGMPAEPEFELNLKNCVAANITYTFHGPKLSMLLPYAGLFCQYFKTIGIGLMDDTKAKYQYVESSDIAEMLQPLDRFTYKHKKGQTLIIGGSEGKTGSVILSGQAALNSGTGLLFCILPQIAVQAFQTLVPEGMYMVGGDHWIRAWNSDLAKGTVGIGPGLGFETESLQVLIEVLECGSPLVIDADAIRLIANEDLHNRIPVNSILTPHEAELKSLVGSWNSEQEKLAKLESFCTKHQVVVVLKGAYTIVCDGVNLFFNSSGTPEMATAGSGDVLLGMISSFRSQGYSALKSAQIGVFIHGLAAQMYLDWNRSRTLIASDFIGFIGPALAKVAEKLA